jgi:hypothetical protein
VGRLQAGIGPSIELFTDDAIFYALASFRIEFGPALSRGFRYGPLAQAGIIAQIIPPYKAQLEGEIFWDVDQSDRQPHFYVASLNQSYSLGPRWDLLLKASKIFSATSPVGSLEAGINSEELVFGGNFYFD